MESVYDNLDVPVKKPSIIFPISHPQKSEIFFSSALSRNIYIFQVCVCSTGRYYVHIRNIYVFLVNTLWYFFMFLLMVVLIYDLLCELAYVWMCVLMCLYTTFGKVLYIRVGYDKTSVCGGSVEWRRFCGFWFGLNGFLWFYGSDS